MSEPPPDLDLTNPKDRVGQSKIDLSLFPPAAHIHGAHAFMDGARKYGAYNWREKQVRARVYISAAQRHLADFLDRQDIAEDSGVHHLGHVIACCGIILDAIETGNLIDDRPVTGAAAAILDRLNAAILARATPQPADVATSRIVVASTPTITIPDGLSAEVERAVSATLRRVMLADEVSAYPPEGGEPLTLQRRNVVTSQQRNADCGCPDGQTCPGVDALYHCPRSAQ